MPVSTKALLWVWLIVGILWISSLRGLFNDEQSWHSNPGSNTILPVETSSSTIYTDPHENSVHDTNASARHASRVSFKPGKPRAPGYEFTHIMVIPRTKAEDISWMDVEIPSIPKAIYIADDPSAPLHPPKNKGHEVMIYLTYIIDHYDSLPDIILFMHAHRWTHHNNELLGYDAAQMVRRLNYKWVVRNGYMNLRCPWNQGCPEWLRSEKREQILERQEEFMLTRFWGEMFPMDPLPAFLAQPCCGQFAVSRERILEIPRSRFVYYRDWILRTPLSDYISGRLWEYSWQYIFTSQAALCPAEHICYCDGFGVCFATELEYQDWMALTRRKKVLEAELGLQGTSEQEGDGSNESGELRMLDLGRTTYLKDEIAALVEELEDRRQEALDRGDRLRMETVEELVSTRALEKSGPEDA